MAAASRPTRQISKRNTGVREHVVTDYSIQLMKGGEDEARGDPSAAILARLRLQILVKRFDATRKTAPIMVPGKPHDTASGERRTYWPTIFPYRCAAARSSVGG